MKMKKWHRVLTAMTSGVAVITAWIGFCGYQWSWGPFARLHDIKTAGIPGNTGQYSLNKVKHISNSPLKGKHIIFLGSSVTYGSASQGISFVDYIASRNGCTFTKEAVSGTTLVDIGLDSYVSRLKKLDTDMKADLFVCQLSTNDAGQKRDLGTVSESFDIGEFDIKTVAGAKEYIITYAKETWGCPVVFYTNSKYDSADYAAMVDLLHVIQKKWNIPVIDMWSDVGFNDITPEKRKLYMADAVHPTKAGYLEWWTPYMEKVMKETVADGLDG